MFQLDQQAVLNLVNSLVDYILASPSTAVFLLLCAYLLYWIVSLREIVVDFPNEVPVSTRQLPTQRLPPPFPNGWIAILESRVLAPSSVKSVQAFGQELAVIRGAKGQVYVIDAYCPHLGAHLGVGGTVHQDCKSGSDCIRCPFHGWSYSLDGGQCVAIPYEDDPVNAHIKVWTTLEINNAIFVWYHATGEPPTWRPTLVKEIATGEWVFRGRSEHWVNCHIQEIPENGADVAHLGEIHVDPFYYGSNLDVLNIVKRWRPFEHHWTAIWTACGPPNEHMSSIDITNSNRLFGWSLFDVQLKVNQIGPAYVELRLESSFMGGVKGVLLQFVKPVERMRNCIIHQVYTENTLAGAIFGKFLLLGESKMLERDIRIWNRKVFLSRPFVSKSEKSLVKYRRWYSQFYSSGNMASIDW